MLAATFMGQADGFIVTVAVPSLQRDLPATFGEVQLVGAAYVLAAAAGLITGGRLGDRFGRRRVFLTGVTVFTLASLVCGAAPNAAAAALIPQELALIRVIFTGSAQRARAISAYAVVVGLEVIFGLAGGGLLVQGGTASLVRTEVVNGVLPVPENLDEATWWGARPGAISGATVLAGHVNWNGDLGPFAELWRAEVGDRVSVVDRTSRVLHYTITEVLTLDKDELPRSVAELFARPVGTAWSSSPAAVAGSAAPPGMRTTESSSPPATDLRQFAPGTNCGRTQRRPRQRPLW